jgi:predicted RNA-binding Zn ribbon-like protein
VSNLSPIYIMNSDWTDWRKHEPPRDRLLEPEWLKWFLERWGFSAQPLADDKVMHELIDLRELLREIVRETPDGRLSENALTRLNFYLKRAPLVRSVANTGEGPVATLTPAQPGWEGIMAEIATLFIDMLREHPGRLRTCEHPDCHWIFLDESRNRTRRWCGNACGNVMKVRRFRERQKA